jgi:hypothetical protein
VKFSTAATKTVHEGAQGTKPVSVTLKLNRPSPEPVTVFWSTKHGTANRWDYSGGSGWVTFAPGDTLKSITVAVNGDTRPEPDETFTVNLSDPVNARLGASVKPILILNDD